MRIRLTSILVEDQEHALGFYTGVLGFAKRADVPAGEARWLTVGPAEAPDDPDLLLEPVQFPPARAYQAALHDAGIPLTAFSVDDVHAEYRRLHARGVVFRTPPTAMGPATVAVFDDTCGNWIQIYQV